VRLDLNHTGNINILEHDVFELRRPPSSLRAEAEAIHRLALLAGGLLRTGQPALAMTREGWPIFSSVLRASEDRLQRVLK
jgi:hypothetical protein